MSNVEYRTRIYTSDGGSVQHTFQSAISDIQAVGAQVIRFTEGRTESVPWTVGVIDQSSGITNILADTSGRMTLLHRLMDFQRRIDSTATTDWSTLVTGRIADIPLNSDVASYQFVVEDERTIERTAQIWTGGRSDVYLIPPARNANYGNFPGQYQTAFGLNIRISHGALGGNEVITFPWTYESIPQPVADAIVGDMTLQSIYIINPGGDTPDVGNFASLRMRIVTIAPTVGATPVNINQDFEVLTFADRPEDSPPATFRLPSDPVQPLRDRLPHPIRMVLAGGQAGTTNLVTGYLTGYLYFPDAPALPGNPYFLGSSAGMHPVQLAYDILTGSYSEQSVRVSTAAFDTMLADRSYPRVRYIVTEPANMAEWLQEHIYQPFGIVPFIDEQGRIAPESVRLPNPATISTGSLFGFTSANLVQHPTWLHTAREIVTVLRFHWRSEQSVAADVILPISGDLGDQPSFSFAPENQVVYGIALADHVIEKRHDRVAQFGERVVDITLDGIHDRDTAERQAKVIAREFFDRYGDGAIQGTLLATSTGETVGPGDFATITLNTFPNPQSQGRGGTRIIQIMSRAYLPGRGVECEWLDAGPHLGVLTTPTVSLAVSTSDAYHSLIATVGGLTTGGTVLVQLAESTGTVPSSDSASWVTYLSTVSSSGTYAIGPLNSGSYQWGRARAAAPNRIRSAWGYSTANPNLTALTGPSSFQTSSVTQGTANLYWLNSTSNPDAPIEILLNEAVALDTFTDTSGTVINAHTPDVGFNGWYHSASTMVIVIGSNRAAPSTAAVISSGLVLSSANIANDYFSIQAIIDLVDNATTNTPQGGIVFRGSSSTGSTSLEYQVLVLTPNAGLNNIVLRTVAGGTLALETAVVAFNTSESKYNIGVSVAGQSITPFWQPVGTTGVLTYGDTITSTYYNDTGHQRMGLYVNTTFTVNQPIYDTLVASLATDIGERLTILPEGSTHFALYGLSTGRGYLATVRHVDPFPLTGFSASTSLTFVPTTSAAVTPPALTQFGIFLGTTA